MSDTNTALSVVDPNSSALAAFGIDEDAPLKPSRLSLLQPIQVSDEPGLLAGRFLDEQSNVQYESINIVPLLMTTGRVLFPPGGELGAKPLCRSNDGLMPQVDGDLVRQDGGKGCAKCTKSQWVKVGGKSIRPPCNETMSFLFAELETSFIYRLNIKGQALKPVKDLRDTIRKMVVMAKAKGGFVPPYGLSFKLSSVKVRGPKGTYYLPKFVPTGGLSLEDTSKFQSIYTYFTTRKAEEGDEVELDPVETALEGEYVPTTGTYEAA